MKIEQYPAWIFPIGSAFVGAVSWSGCMPALALSILMPISVTLQKTRRSAFLTAFGYYAGASWPLIPGAKAFFGANATWFESVLLWLISSYLLALPFGVFWMSSFRRRPLGTMLALLAVAVPPIGLIGWASPFIAAGIFFPGTAWLGLAMTLLICSLSARFPRFLFASSVLLFVLAHGTYRQPLPPASWQAINTKFGSESSASDPLGEFRIAEIIQHIIRKSDSKVLIFPEMVIDRWNDATRAFWEPTLKYARGTGKTILIGAGLSVSGQSQSYLNCALILGAHPAPPFTQRIPVPLAMWKPYKPLIGVPLRLRSPGTTMFADKRVAILICYEQLLVWPILASAAEYPGILIGLSNGYWSMGTSIPKVQQACLNSWAHLFGIPFISASNS